MGLPLRITYENTDYTFQILNATPINRSTEQIQILLNGITQTLIRERNQWTAKETAGENQSGLTEAIGKAIALRYRI